MKRTAARPQDLLDIEQLESIARRRRGGDPEVEQDWRGDFRAAEERRLESSLLATPAERLKWLEEALVFAAKMGALQRGDEDARK